MQWSDYAKMAGGIYTPEIKQTASNKSKLIVAEGLSPKNLLKMPAKPVLEDKMTNDLRKFVSGKPILNEIAPALAAVIPAIVGAGEAGAAGVAATGAAGVAGGAVAGETAAAGAAAAGQTAASSLAADTGAGIAAAPSSGEVVAQQLSQTNNAGTFMKDVVSNTNVDTNPQQTSHPNDQEAQ